MRSSIFLSFAVASSAARVRASESWRDSEWSYTPEHTGDWYRDHDLALPELAAPITTVAENKSYVVKLECAGCPFRVRELGQVVETWQEPPQDNSLLLNFTINDDGAASTLLLNGHRIAPVASLPLHLFSFQVPANLSATTMAKMTAMHMLDESWRVGTKYGQFELQYERAMLATERPDEEWVQFDITTIHMRQQSNPGHAALNKPDQKIAQLLLSRVVIGDEPQLFIKEIQLVERNDREMPIKMPCGKDAIVKIEFNPLEWDYYGKFGTWSRTMHLALGEVGDFLDRNGLFVIIFAVLFSVVSIVRWYMRRNEAKAVQRVQGDAEAAVLLAPEHEDPPPAYKDESQSEEQERYRKGEDN